MPLRGEMCIRDRYTDKWLKETIFQFNREWRDMLALAVAENNGEISKRMAQYTTIKNTNFTHNLSKRDIADLQFLQTLIKTRILKDVYKRQVLCFGSLSARHLVDKRGFSHVGNA